MQHKRSDKPNLLQIPVDKNMVATVKTKSFSSFFCFLDINEKIMPNINPITKDAIISIIGFINSQAIEQFLLLKRVVAIVVAIRSEEHTSELQSRQYLVC